MKGMRGESAERGAAATPHYCFASAAARGLCELNSPPSVPARAAAERPRATGRPVTRGAKADAELPPAFWAATGLAAARGLEVISTPTPPPPGGAGVRITARDEAEDGRREPTEEGAALPLPAACGCGAPPSMARNVLRWDVDRLSIAAERAV